MAQAADQPADTVIAGLRDRQQKLEKWSGIAGLTTFSVILLTLIVVVFWQMILRGGLLIIPGTFLILVAIGAGAMGFFQTYAKSLKREMSRRGLIAASNPLAIEEPSLQSPESVTTRTTELLTGGKNQSSATSDL